jgi:hypothetical protein
MIMLFTKSIRLLTHLLHQVRSMMRNIHHIFLSTYIGKQNYEFPCKLTLCLLKYNENFTFINKIQKLHIYSKDVIAL